MKPKWLEEKEKLRNQEPEELVFIGEPGAAGVIDGKLPNGEEYEWSKQDRKLRRRWRKSNGGN